MQAGRGRAVRLRRRRRRAAGRAARRRSAGCSHAKPGRNCGVGTLLAADLVVLERVLDQRRDARAEERRRRRGTPASARRSPSIAWSAPSPSSPSAVRIRSAIVLRPSRRSSSAISSDCCAPSISPGTSRPRACFELRVGLRRGSPRSLRLQVLRRLRRRPGAASKNGSPTCVSDSRDDRGDLAVVVAAARSSARESSQRVDDDDQQDEEQEKPPTRDGAARPAGSAVGDGRRRPRRRAARPWASGVGSSSSSKKDMVGSPEVCRARRGGRRRCRRRGSAAARRRKDGVGMHGHRRADRREPDPSWSLGRYRLGRAPGAGGFGTVYEAHDERLTAAWRSRSSRPTASAACARGARRWPPRGSTTPASSPSTTPARRTARATSSPSWSRARRSAQLEAEAR